MTKLVSITLMSTLAFCHLYADEPRTREMVYDKGVFLKDGRKYRKFESTFGSIFVLETSNLTKEDIERAQCASGLPSGKAQETDTPLIGVETAGTEGEGKGWKAYAALIQKTIRTRCDGSVFVNVKPEPHLDLGISTTVGKKGEEKEIKVFNRDLAPNINFGTTF